MPVVELLKYLDMQIEKERQEAEQEQVKLWLNYLSMVFTTPQMEKPSAKFKNAKKEFENSLKPQLTTKKKRKKYQWDFEKENSINSLPDKGGR